MLLCWKICLTSYLSLCVLTAEASSFSPPLRQPSATALLKTTTPLTQPHVIKTVPASVAHSSGFITVLPTSHSTPRRSFASYRHFASDNRFTPDRRFNQIAVLLRTAVLPHIAVIHQITALPWFTCLSPNLLFYPRSQIYPKSPVYSISPFPLRSQ